MLLKRRCSVVFGVVCVWLSLACGMACAPIASPVTVEALVLDPNEVLGVRRADVKLHTVTDLAHGLGEDFVAIGGLRMAGLTIANALEDGDDFDELIAKSRDDGGQEFAPRMQFDGQRYIAEDVEALTMFSAFAAFERIFTFAKTIGDDLGASDNAVIGISSEVVAADVLPIPLLTSDNAAYAPALDGWLTLTAVIQEGVPFGMHPGILAHEFGHRLMFRNLFTRDDAAFELWRKYAQLEPDEPLARGYRLLRGLDEGLADIFAIGMSEDVDVLVRAFETAGPSFVPEAARRDLEAAFADDVTYDNLNDLTLDVGFLTSCGASDDSALFDQADYNIYCFGTLMARVIWDAAERDIEQLRSVFMPAIVSSFAALSQALQLDPEFDADVFINMLVPELPTDAQARLCEGVASRFASLVQEGRVTACP